MENTESIDGVEVLPFADEQAFASRLAVHHTRHEGVWLKLARKGSGIPSLTSDQAVDVGLCHGWISGRRRGLDERYYLQKYVPRRPGSLWSQVNVEKVAVLTAEGRMREPGLAEVRRAGRRPVGARLRVPAHRDRPRRPRRRARGRPRRRTRLPGPRPHRPLPRRPSPAPGTHAPGPAGPAGAHRPAARRRGSRHAGRPGDLGRVGAAEFGLLRTRRPELYGPLTAA